MVFFYLFLRQKPSQAELARRERRLILLFQAGTVKIERSRMAVHRVSTVGLDIDTPRNRGVTRRAVVSRLVIDGRSMRRRIVVPDAMTGTTVPAKTMSRPVSESS
jgi:hypothetical protein